MISDSSLKEYYVRLNTLYNNALNILTGLNQSLSSTSSEVSVTVVDNMNVETTVRIPSFLFLESKIEEINNNVKSIFNLPKSGSAWFSLNNSMFKLNMVKSNTAPETPNVETNINALTASTTQNNFLKDLVNPKTYLKLNVSNLTPNIELIFMKKMVIYDQVTYQSLKDLNLDSYDDIKSMLFNYAKGVDYDEYDSVIDLPIKKSKYKSYFMINNIPSLPLNNPWLDESTNHYQYELQLSTLNYTDSEDSTIQYTLKKGDKLTIVDQLVVYLVKEVSISSNTVWVEEIVGHQNLDTTISLQVYEYNFDEYNYIQVPLEENQYICVFVSAIYNNVRSELSKPILVDLGSIIMYDEYGNPLIKSNGERMTYMEYYKTYCTNIGDLILGLTQTAYPQISNYTVRELQDLQEGDQFKLLAGDTLLIDTKLQVIPINKHLVDDVTNEELISLHALKNEFNSQLESIQSNIDQTYNTLITTDFTQNQSLSQIDLQNKLQKYYTERTTATRQIIQLVNNINTKIDQSSVKSKTKYRIRGITDISKFEEVLKTYDNVKIIGMDLLYKYKSVTKDTTTVNIIEENTFTDWNTLFNIDRQRVISINTTLNTLEVLFELYNTDDNKIKWNQVDIPIQQGEDVIMRVRYKYNIGQPFINLYSPWSLEYTMHFPDQYTENIEVVNIIDQNEKDTISANFNNTLINDGYTEHITNSLITGNQRFYHLPENIYSGFNTADNNLISLKDKLYSMVNQISNIEAEVNKYVNNKFSVFLTYDDIKIELFANQVNKLNLTDDGNDGTNYVRKDMNIVIVNTGENPIYLYSIFPGNINQELLMTNNEYYNQYIGDYQSVPLFANNKIVQQVLGQWIYFRSKNPYTKRSIYKVNNNISWPYSPSSYIRKDFVQPAFAYRNRTLSDIDKTSTSIWNAIYKVNDRIEVHKYTELDQSNISNWDNISSDDVMYKNDLSKFINRYEDIYFIDQKSTNQQKVYLNDSAILSDFIEKFNENIEISEITTEFSDINNYNGAFIFPNINAMSEILTNGDIQDKKTINVGESISIPIVYEYYINGNIPGFSDITKGLYFDLRNSLFVDPKHYMVEITAKHDVSYSTYNYMNIADVLEDQAKDAR